MVTEYSTLVKPPTPPPPPPSPLGGGGAAVVFPVVPLDRVDQLGAESAVFRAK
ncbi:hypothetical protein ACFLW4_06185 [Chloroflexota bacterium]